MKSMKKLVGLLGALIALACGSGQYAVTPPPGTTGTDGGGADGGTGWVPALVEHLTWVSDQTSVTANWDVVNGPADAFLVEVFYPNQEVSAAPIHKILPGSGGLTHFEIQITGLPSTTDGFQLKVTPQKAGGTCPTAVVTFATKEDPRVAFAKLVIPGKWQLVHHPHDGDADYYEDVPDVTVWTVPPDKYCPSGLRAGPIVDHSALCVDMAALAIFAGNTETKQYDPWGGLDFCHCAAIGALHGAAAQATCESFHQAQSCTDHYPGTPNPVDGAFVLWFLDQGADPSQALVLVKLNN